MEWDGGTSLQADKGSPTCTCRGSSIGLSAAVGADGPLGGLKGGLQRVFAELLLGFPLILPGQLLGAPDPPCVAVAPPPM